jgi:DNA-directed RNA polymerase subunit RPC12/RpoP
MSPDEKDEAMCPKCQSKLIYIEHYQSYYCSSCDEHFELAKEGSKAEEELALAHKATPSISETDLAIKEIEESLLEPKSESPLPPPPPGYKKSSQSLYEKPSEPQYQEPQNTYEDSAVQPIYDETHNEGNKQTEYEIPKNTASQETVYEDSQEEYIESEPSEIQEEEEYISELDSGSELEGVPESEIAPTASAVDEGKKRRKKFKNYRYRTRMIKGSILPILFGIISFQMINSSRLQFPDYYELEAMMILMGFLLGFSIVSGITVANLIKAKKSSTNGYQLNMKVGIVAYLPFIVIFLALTLFVSLSTGWKFATGFFLASIFPFLIVTLFEASSKGKFFVKEMVDDPSWGRKLVFKQ